MFHKQYLISSKYIQGQRYLQECLLGGWKIGKRQEWKKRIFSVSWNNQSTGIKWNPSRCHWVPSETNKCQCAQCMQIPLSLSYLHILLVGRGHSVTTQHCAQAADEKMTLGRRSEKTTGLNGGKEVKINSVLCCPKWHLWNQGISDACDFFLITHRLSCLGGSPLTSVPHL